MLITQDSETRRYGFALDKGFPTVTLGPNEWLVAQRLEVVLTWSPATRWVFNSAIVTGRHSRTNSHGQAEFPNLEAMPEWAENSARLVLGRANRESAA